MTKDLGPRCTKPLYWKFHPIFAIRDVLSGFNPQSDSPVLALSTVRDIYMYIMYRIVSISTHNKCLRALAVVMNDIALWI